MEKYLGGEAISEAEIRAALRKGTIAMKIVPVVAGSAFKNKGVQTLLDAVVDYLPSPLDIPPMHGDNPDTGNDEVRTASDDEPFTALAFKIMTDPVRRVAHVPARLLRRARRPAPYVFNSVKGRKERVGRLLKMHANKREEIKEVYAGDICAAVGPPRHDDGRHALRRGPADRPRAHAVPRAGHLDRDRAEDEGRPGEARRRARARSRARTRRSACRPTPRPAQTLISGMGELHLEIIVDRLMREFKVDANVGKPQVAYRETIRKAVENETRFVRQTGGRGQYGHVVLHGRAAGSRRRLRVRRRHEGRRDPARVHARDREGHQRSARYRRARRLPGRRRQGDGHVRVVPRGRLVGDGLQDRGLDVLQGGRAARPIRSSSSPSCRSRW